MQILKIQVLTGLLLGVALAANAQVIINTGNPAIQKYKTENPNAVIWDPGKPIPVNVSKEPVAKPAKAATAPAVKETPKVSVEPKAVKPEMPKETAKPEMTHAASNAPAAPSGPPNAEPGKCYVQVPVPDKYEYVEEQVLDKPAYKKIVKVPAKYETVYDTIIVKPAVVKKIETPAEYETVMEQVLVTPAQQKWVQGKSNPDCKSPNPKDCEVWTLEEIPAVYKTVPKKVEKSPAQVREVVIPAETKVMPRSKMVAPAREEEVEVPATYKTIMQKKLVSKGEGMEWKEVPCKNEPKSDRLLKVQKALIREGYDPGPPDNKMGAKTQEAIAKFQKDKGLPQGGLNAETLRALGVE